jgi:HSP20 family protein
MKTLVKHTGHNPALMNGFLGKEAMSELFAPAFNGSSPAVNVLETEDGYRIEVAAPGLQKSDFRLNLDQNRLTIGAHKEGQEEEKTHKYTRREFSYSSFQRTFIVPTTVDGERIAATYTDGVLSIELPKKEEAKAKPNRTIEIV